jgi:TrmH family RNA methyltransferase
VDPLSDQNPLIRQIRRAASRGTLTDDGCAIAEGSHLVEEAVAARCEIRAVLVTSLDARFPDAKLVTEKTFRSLASTETPQGILALVKLPVFTMETITAANLTKICTLAIVLDGVQDPGNAGSIVRAADAFGATGAIFLKGSVNPYNPKCIRASAGSIFRLPVVSGAELADLGSLTVYAAMPRAEKLLDEADFTQPCAIVIGSEGHGVRPAVAERAIGLRIPTSHVESLNAAVAAGVLLYEARRQRDSSQRKAHR